MIKVLLSTVGLTEHHTCRPQVFSGCLEVFFRNNTCSVFEVSLSMCVCVCAHTCAHIRSPGAVSGSFLNMEDQIFWVWGIKSSRALAPKALLASNSPGRLLDILLEVVASLSPVWIMVSFSICSRTQYEAVLRACSPNLLASCFWIYEFFLFVLYTALIFTLS